MSRILYEIAQTDGRRPSIYCWRVKYALAFKGLEYTTKPLSVIEIPKLYGGEHKTVPVLDDDGHVVGDSMKIADYLDERCYGQHRRHP